MSELRQRTKKEAENDEGGTMGETQTKTLAERKQEQQRRRKAAEEARKKELRRTFKLLAFSVLGMLVMYNASVRNAQRLGFMLNECHGSFCDVNDLDTLDRECGPWHTERVVYIRIPKTGSTSVTQLLGKLSLSKAFDTRNLPEWADAVPRLYRSYVSPVDQNRKNFGYTMDPNETLTAQYRYQFFGQVARHVMFPNGPYNKTIWAGHMYHLEWKYAPDLFQGIQWLDEYIGDTLSHEMKMWLRIEPPTKEEMSRVAEISFVRNPEHRLRSMYTYDRTSARNQFWRNDLVEERGNLTFEDCLQSEDCIQVNELDRWCSLQTEFFCGLDEKCQRPINDQAVEIAKANIKEMFIFVGVIEKWKESLVVLENLLPLYFEGASNHEELHVRKAEHPHSQVKNPVALENLKRVCAKDWAIYNYVQQLVEERLEKYKYFSN